MDAVKYQNLWLRFMLWRTRKMSHRTYIMLLSAVVGVLSGFAAVVLRNAVIFMRELLTHTSSIYEGNFLYFALPAIGILLAILFIRYVIKDNVGHGVPSVLYSISRQNGIIKKHNIYSSIVASALTVGFGGSVGVEGPTIATGAAVGSNIGQYFRLSYKDLILLMTVACVGAMSAIFKSPIAAIVFALEVIMIDLTMASLVPMLIASVTAVLTSYFFLGNAVLYPTKLTEGVYLHNLPYYILLGVLTGLVSVYFTRVTIRIEEWFKRFDKWWMRWLIGGMVLGVLIFFFPALYGEGYESVNTCLGGDYSPLFNQSPFYDFQTHYSVVFLLFFLVLVFKAIATAVTFGAGGVGGSFAPALFMGAFTGLFFSEVVNYTGITILPTSNFAMVGMSGIIAGMLHAPLTGIFLIAEITDGYALIIPLMLVSTISYATSRIFMKETIYTYQLSQRGDLFTHHKDRNVMGMMKVEQFIEKDFVKIHPEAKLRDLIKIISESKRNIFPVVDEEDYFKGFIRLDDIRNIIFKPELYDQILVTSLMVSPAVFVDPDDTMEIVAEKFKQYDKYNLPVLKDGKYIGFISRANVFAQYRELVKQFSED
jgi:chloride channel protein, CIC family